MKYDPEKEEPEWKTIEHYKKINILGYCEVGKSSLISLMEHYEDDLFEISDEIKNDSLNELAEIKKIKIPISDKNNLYLNIYETNLNQFNNIYMNLDTLLLHTECIIIMWDYEEKEILLNEEESDSFFRICDLLTIIKNEMKDRFNKKVPIFLIKNKSDLKNNPNGVISDFKDDVETIKKSLKNEKNQKPDELDDYIKFKEISLKNKNGFDDFILSLCKELSLYQEQKSLHYKYIGINSVIIFNDCKKKSNSIINILLLGDKDVGKTTFCNYFLEENKKINERTEDLKIMAEVLGKNIFVKICKIDDMNKLQTIFYEPEFFLLFFDVGNKQSFENLEKWISKIRVNKNNYKIILLGNKIDRNDVRII